MTELELKDELEGAIYRFAKTMPWCPHWYTLRKTWEDPARFEACVLAIRRHGEQRRWGRYNHTYFDADQWYYWTMGAPAEETILINRAKMPWRPHTARRRTR